MNQLVIERDFDAPIEKVWDAFTNPEVLKMWWSPPGMSNSFMSADVTEGGKFRYCFKSDDDGKEYWGRGVYTKIDKPHYLAYKDAFTDAEGNDVTSEYYGIPGPEGVMETLVEFFFTEEDGKTHMKMVGENPYDESMTADMTKGWNGMFANLDEAFRA